MRFFTLLILFAVWPFALTGVTAADGTFNQSDFADLSTAQKGQIWDQAIHILGGNANVTSRWVDDVRFTIVADDAALEDYAHGVLKRISTLTSLPVAMVSSEFSSVVNYVRALEQAGPYQLMPCSTDSACANLVVVVSDIETMSQIARAVPLRDVYQNSLEEGELDSENRAVCFFAPFQRASVIRQAMVFVRADLPVGMLRTCLQEEIYQSFGLFNDFTDSEYYSFNNRVEEKKITGFDRALLRAVYEFPAGAPAFKVAKRLLTNLEDMH